MAEHLPPQRELDLALESLEAAARAYNANIERAIREAAEDAARQNPK